MKRLRTLLPVLIATAIAAYFRLYAIDRLPPALFGDEAADGFRAAEIAAGESLPVYIEEPGELRWTSREPLYHYFVAAVFAVFGPSTEALRASSAMIGTATLLLFGVLVRMLFGTHTALAASVLLASGTWHVGVSRLGMRAVTVPLCEVAAVLAFVVLLRRRSPVAALLFGGVLAIGFYSYPAYWMTPVALLLVAVAALVENGAASQWKAPAGWAAAAFVIVAAPLFLYLMAKPDLFLARPASTANVFQLSASDHESPPFFRDNLQRVLFMLHLRGDTNLRHNVPGRPMLDPVSGVLFLFGLWRLLRDRDLGLTRRAGVLAFWLLPLLPSAVTDSAPHALRAVGATPAIALIAALGVERVARLVARIGAPATATTLVLLAGAGFLNHRAYFVDYAALPELPGAFSDGATRFYEFVAELADHSDVYLSAEAFDAPHRGFFAHRRPGHWHRIEDESGWKAAPTVRDRIFVCDDPLWLDRLATRYPTAEVVTRYNLPGGRRGIVLRVRPQPHAGNDP